MSYKLNKTDGTLLVDLIDGQIDTASTSITLVGKNYSGFGEFLNENYIKLLENFSNSTSPVNPITGQVWWDSSDSRLKVYNGTTFKAVGGPFVQPTQPTMVAGDLWINNNINLRNTPWKALKPAILVSLNKKSLEIVWKLYGS